MNLFSKYFVSFAIFFIFLTNCSTNPGINKTPKNQNKNEKIIVSEYSIDDVGINIINLNKLSEKDIKNFNLEKIEEIDFQIKKFENIYDYRYEYILGAADIISINLTDSDDIDNTYLIDQDGMIDLPFIGKVKIDGLTLNEAQNVLMNVVESFYKNPDMQLNIEEFNSSKVYVVGAVRNQVTINLDQKPIKLIEAAIQANFNPSGAIRFLVPKAF